MIVSRTDIVIVGAGPAGLYAAFEAGRHGMSAHIVDAQVAPGGQCAELYPEKPIYDIPGFVSCTGSELTRNLLAQIDRFKPAFHFGVQARTLQPSSQQGRWTLSLSNGEVIDAGAVTIAAGGGAFEPRRLSIEDAVGVEDHTLLYSVRDVEMLRGKRVLVVGGGDSALDWALTLVGVAKSVGLVHRRDSFRAAPASIERLQHLSLGDDIARLTGHISRIEKSGSQITSVEVESHDGQRSSIECDYLLVFFGLTNKLGPISDWGLDDQQGTIPVAPQTMQTVREGVYAIGDVAIYPGKLKLILSGFHESAVMAIAAHKRVFGRPPRLEHSTHSKALTTASLKESRAGIDVQGNASPGGQPSVGGDYIMVDDLHGRRRQVPARDGQTLLDLLMEAKIEIKASCYGACNCSTCHVYVDEQWASKIPAMHEQEQEALDQVSCPLGTSRLACQIEYRPELLGLPIRLSADTQID